MSTLVIENEPATLVVESPQIQIITVYGDGVQGPRGADGAVGADLTYTHNQTVPASTWSVTHNLGKFPSPIILDSSGDQVFGTVHYADVNHATLTFSGAFSGKAVFN